MSRDRPARHSLDFQDRAAVRAAARKGAWRLLLVIVMIVAEITVINVFGVSAAIWPVVGAMALFLVLNRLIDF
jgi:hypothetical protein